MQNVAQNIWHEAQRLNDQRLAERRDFTGEEAAMWDRLNDDLDRNQNLRCLPRERQISRRQLFGSLPENLRTLASEGLSRRQQMETLAASWADSHTLAAMDRWVLGGAQGLSREERLSLQTDVDTSGGTMVAPEAFVAQLIKFMDDLLFFRDLATVIPLTEANSAGIPTLDTDVSDADWTTELATGNEDTAMATGKRLMTPHPLAKLIKASKTWLRRAASLSPSMFVAQRLAYKFAVSYEKACMTGDGVGKPLGVFVNSPLGITSARDISSGNSTTAVSADGLINAKYSLKEAYQKNAAWLFHRTVVRDIRKLKDGNGQYLWTPGLTGTPGTLLEAPIYMSEYVPNTMTTGQYVGIVGDFSFYWIVESLQVQVQQLVELYATSNQDGFIGRMEADGAPVLGEAFARVTLA